MPGAVTVDSPFTPASGGAPTATAGAGDDPATLGRFRIERLVGAGSFGVVYRAYDPSLKRVVALKVARPEQLQSPRRVERFLREARAAGGLMHPHIVAVFDSGKDGDRHYIASAFVEGRSLDAALEELPDGQALPLRRAVEIVRRLAEALAYAHKQGVVHRDVKPSNVLLRDDGEPMLTDFGLAIRADEERMTQADQVLGTPAYMAPEQARGQAGPASDQYSLGCVFFELLTGQGLFPGTGADLVHALYLHQHQAAPSPRSLRPEVPRDLETVCLKCLEKDPQKRYATCQELADDLRRWLEDEPVQARRVKWLERMGRWARRNPAVAGLTTAVVAILVGATAVAWVLAARAERHAEQARQEARRADAKAAEAREYARQSGENERRAVVNAGLAQNNEQQARAEAERTTQSLQFLANLFRSFDPLEFLGYGLRMPNEHGRNLTAKDLLDRGAKQLQSGELKDKQVRASLLLTLGDVYRSLGHRAQADKWLQEAVKLEAETVGKDHPGYARALYFLGWHRFDEGDYDQAEDLFARALKVQNEKLGPGHADTVDTQFLVGWTLVMYSDPRSMAILEQVVNHRARLHGETHHLTMVAKMGLACAYIEQGEVFKALPMIKDVAEYSSRLGGGKNNLRAVTLFHQGFLQESAGLTGLAQRSYLAALKLGKETAGPDSIYLAVVQHQLAVVLSKEKKNAEAERYLLDCIQTIRNSVGLEFPRAALALGSYDDLMEYRGKPLEALRVWRETEAASRRRFGDNNRFRFWYLTRIARLEAKHGSAKAATEAAMEALRLLPRTAGRDERKARDLDQLGWWLVRNNKVNPSVAEACLKESVRIARALPQREAKQISSSLSGYGDLLHGQGRYREAAPLLAEAERIGRGTPSVQGDIGMILYKQLGDIRLAEGRFADATSAYRKALGLSRNEPEPKIIDALIDLAGPSVEQGNWDEAIKALRQAAYYQRKSGTVHYDRPFYLLALVQEAAGRPAEARATLRQLAATFQFSPRSNSRLVVARGALLLAPGAVTGPRQALCAVGGVGREPASALVYQNLVLAHLRLNEPDDAATLLDCSPEPPRFRAPFVPLLRAWIAHQRGQSAQARALVDAARKEGEGWALNDGSLDARARTRWRDRLEHRLLLAQLEKEVHGTGR